MADVLKDFVVETSSSTGTGTLALIGAADTGYRSFVSAYGTGVTALYCIRNAAHDKWEIGYGVITDASPDTLSRNLIESSTGSLISWIAGDAPLEVYVAPLNFVINSLLKNHRGTARPAWLPAWGMWIGDGTGANARTVNIFDGTNDIVAFYVDETNNYITVADPTVGGHIASKTYVDANDYNVPNGRLTLTTALAIPVADQTAKTSIFYTPFEGRRLPIPYGAGVWKNIEFAELTLAFDSSSGHTGYQQAAKLFDCFVWDSGAGVLKLGTGPAWSSDTARTDAITLDNGRWVNNASIVLKSDTTAGTTTVAAKNALYVGTIYMTANGQTEDSYAKRFVWNTYNRRMRPMRVIDATDTWTYTLSAVRQARATAANQLDFVRGLDEDYVEATVIASWSNSSVAVNATSTIGLDNTSVAVANQIMSFITLPAAAQAIANVARWTGFPGLGRHYLVWQEASAATGTTTWTGDNGGAVCQSGIHGGVFA